MSDTIIAGIDLDAPDQARDAVALASWLADATSSDLVLATVFAPRPGALNIQLERRRRELAALAGRPVETIAIAGTSPARVLHELADQRRPRALVIGSSRAGAVGLVSLGSVGELLLHGGGAPVAVAPSDFRPPSDRPVDIGVAYGVTPESDDAVRVAVDLAQRAGARLRVLTVHEPAPHHEMPERRPGEHLERALAGADAERVELSGDPALALARATADLDLLVAGSRSYGPLGAVLLGAVTRRLVHAAQCPVMVVPRTRDAALAVALVGGMEAAVDV
jgi:nucleotide-binding universal stress UspA family protein